MAFLTFYITCPDEAVARQIGTAMVQQQLAACANFFPVGSVYSWNGTMEQDHEWVCLLKTITGLEQALESAVTAIHPYEIPCIMRFETRANPAYENWIASSTRSPVS